MDKTEVNAPTTQRAYTLRLRGADGNDGSWRDALWATHEAVNKGAQVFGDWLLTLRGGLSHALADAKVAQGKGKPDRQPTPEERRQRRILLALSWLSVESEHGAPDDESLIVAYGDKCCRKQENKVSLDRKVLAALRDILKNRVVPDGERGDPDKKPEDQPGTWLGDCGPSLCAKIRDDAVWVNRCADFDKVAVGWDTEKARKDAHTLLSFLLKDDFLTLPTSKKAKKNENESDDESQEKENRQATIKASSKGAGQRTRHPFSHLLGEGKPFGMPTRSLSLREQWHKVLMSRLEKATKIPVVHVETVEEKEARKGKEEKKAKAAGPAHTELQREMFSKAAARIAQIVTKQRQQEADRLARESADKDLKAMEHDGSYQKALDALRGYCADYGAESGTTGEFRIRPRQITGWDRVVARWKSIDLADPDPARGKDRGCKGDPKIRRGQEIRRCQSVLSAG